MATNKTICKVCGYIHEGSTAPDICPVCKAPASEFTAVKKKGMFSDVNSNAYIIMYSTVMVVVVATVLAITAMSLSSLQTKNELNEKKINILNSLGLDAATTPFDGTVEAFLVDAQGVASPIKDTEAFDLMKNNMSLRDAIKSGQFILFRAADGRVVIPVVGMGLWGDIWGYIALDKDMNTISGIVMAHKGETPGLGSEIATPKHSAMYKGKQLFQNGEFVSVALRKGGATEENKLHEVDAISGGTKTSDGVTAMLRDCLKNYVPFFHSATTADAAAPAEVSNDQNVENNE